MGFFLVFEPELSAWFSCWKVSVVCITFKININSYKANISDEVKGEDDKLNLVYKIYRGFWCLGVCVVVYRMKGILFILKWRKRKKSKFIHFQRSKKKKSCSGIISCMGVHQILDDDAEIKNSKWINLRNSSNTSTII